MSVKNYIIPSDNWEQQQLQDNWHSCSNYIIPSDNWEQQQWTRQAKRRRHYIIPSDNWEQQRRRRRTLGSRYYIIPSDNWEQQPRNCFAVFSSNYIIPSNYLLPCFGGLKMSNIPQIEKNTTRIGTMWSTRNTEAVIKAIRIKIIIKIIICRVSLKVKTVILWFFLIIYHCTMIVNNNFAKI